MQNPAGFNVTTAYCTDRNNQTVVYPVRNGRPDPSRWLPAKPPGAAAAAPAATPPAKTAAPGAAAGLAAVPVAPGMINAPGQMVRRRCGPGCGACCDQLLLPSGSAAPC